QGPDWPCSSATPPQGRNFILTCLPPYRQSVISGNIGSLLFRLALSPFKKTGLQHTMHILI
ncbi:MAG: hypothetical protein WAO24_03575, partial [Peptococcia bacterium]